MTPPSGQSDSTSGRWYEFEQRETFTRPCYVKATSAREARRILHSGGLVVHDYAPSFPEWRFVGPGRVADDQAYVEEMANDPERVSGSES